MGWSAVRLPWAELAGLVFVIVPLCEEYVFYYRPLLSRRMFTLLIRLLCLSWCDVCSVGSGFRCCCRLKL